MTSLFGRSPTSGTRVVPTTCKARRVRRTLFTAVLSALLVASCASSSSTGASACGPITRDALDPSSLSHVLPGAPTPSYETDPPTSGAHQPTPKVEGFRRQPIAPQIQVGILEQGRVLIQYRGIGRSDVVALRGLVSPEVVVAPAASLPGGAHVVATAWVTRQVCTAVDLEQLRQFISARSGKGPGHP